MKKMSKQNTKKGSEAEETKTVYHAEYVYALGKTENWFSESFWFIALANKMPKTTKQRNNIPKHG